jgi:hypothetical protein
LQAPSIFFEIWYTSANSNIRTRGKEFARLFCGKLAEQRLEMWSDKAYPEQVR